MIRRELDDSRMCCAMGFVTLFPDIFDLSDIMDTTDVVRKTVDWWSFKERLYPFFKAHLLLEPNNGSQVFQIRSFLHFCDLENLLHVPELADDFEDRQPLLKPFYWPFEPKDLGHWDEMRNLFYNTSDSAHLTYVLLAFVPAFIWAFNELKTAVHFDENLIRKLQRLIRRNKRNIGKKKGKQPEEVEVISVAEPDFSLGTGFEIRKEWWAAVPTLEFEPIGEKAVAEAARDGKMVRIAAEQGLTVTMDKVGGGIVVVEQTAAKYVSKHKRKRSLEEKPSQSEEDQRAAKRLEFAMVKEDVPKQQQSKFVEVRTGKY